MNVTMELLHVVERAHSLERIHPYHPAILRMIARVAAAAPPFPS